MQSSSNAFRIASNSLEHIYPENADKDEWSNSDELEPLVWHIGNLTVLEPSYNKQAANFGYDKKVSIYPKSELLMTKEIPENYEQWGEAEVLQRAKRLLSVAKQIWSVE